MGRSRSLDTFVAWLAAKSKPARPCKQQHASYDGALVFMSGWTGIDFGQYAPTDLVKKVDTNAIVSVSTIFPAATGPGRSKNWRCGAASAALARSSSPRRPGFLSQGCRGAPRACRPRLFLETIAGRLAQGGATHALSHRARTPPLWRAPRRRQHVAALVASKATARPRRQGCALRPGARRCG